MAIALRHRYTYADYCKLPDQPRVELVDGGFIVSPSARFEHQEIAARILAPLLQWVDRHNLGKVVPAPMDVILSEHDTVQPDILFIAKERLKIVRDGYVHGAPDLVMEILSPGNEFHDLIVKWRLYERHGVREYWVVDPRKKAITVMTLEKRAFKRVAIYHRDKDVVESKVASGFRLRVADIFRGVKKS